MKKTLIALALMSIAGTAAAKNVKVQADVYSGKELVGTYTAVVADRSPAEFKDKELLTHLGDHPMTAAEASNPQADLQPDEQNEDLGLTLKMTPWVLEDGRIVIDAAYTLTTVEAVKVPHDGVVKEEPHTHVKSIETQLIVGKDTPKLPDEFSTKIGELAVTFSAQEIL